MRKRFSILVVSMVIIGLTLSLSGVLVSQAAPVEKQQSPNREVPKPIPATNIEVVKKVFSEDMEKGKGKPSPPPKTGGAATGILGDYPATGTKYAVVIGICDYPGRDYDICWSDGDSVNMYEALTALYGYDPANVYLLRDTNPNHLDITDGAATYENILQAINEIRAKEVAGDEIVFFFSGHGGWLRDENGNLIDAEPYDEADGKDEALIVHNGNAIVGIPDDTLRLWFSDFETTRIAFVFDTCLAGGQNDVAANGRVVSMATGENQSAYVYSTGDSTTGELGEGVFSHYFVNEGMLQGKADKYDHGYRTNPETLGEDVVVEEAFDYAKTNIPPYLKVRQKPVISDNFLNDLLL
jgi:hypothetical protein